jgi:acetyl esterase
MVDGTPRSRTLRRRWAAGVIAVLVAMGLPLAINFVTVRPAVALLRAMYDREGDGKPVDLTPYASTVSVIKGLPVATPGAPTARLDLYVPRHGSGPFPTLLWIHGGGFIYGSPDQAGGFTAMLAGRGVVVASLDYSLAPDHHYPVPVRQADAALGWLAAHVAAYHGNPAAVFIGGDSSGAQVASQTAALITNPALARDMALVTQIAASAVRGVVLYCGIYDMHTVAGSGFHGICTMLWSYTGQRDWQHAPEIGQLTTTAQATSDYPPTLLTAGDADPLDSRGHELAAALRRRGVDVTAVFYEHQGLGHEYQFNYALPQARQMFATTVAFLTDRSATHDQ